MGKFLREGHHSNVSGDSTGDKKTPVVTGIELVKAPSLLGRNYRKHKEKVRRGEDLFIYHSEVQCQGLEFGGSQGR